MTVLAVALLLAPAAPVPKEVIKIPSHPTAVGTKWEYVYRGNAEKVGTVEITKAETDDGKTTLTMPLTFPDGRVLVERFHVSKDGVWLVSQDEMTYDPPVVHWKLTANAGDTWVEKYVGGTTRYEQTLTVGKPEEITTPAGKFTATPVTGKYAGGGANSVNWYADGVGLVRTTRADEKQPVWELKSFTPGKK